jgi:hypothetical protein
MLHYSARVAGVIAVFLLTGACTTGEGPFGGVVGEGAAERETREIDAFTRIDVSGGIEVELTVGEEPALEIEAQPNLLPIIATEVEGGTLRIDGRKSYTATRTVRVTVSTPSLEGIVLNGGSRAEVTGLDEPSLDVELNGGAQLTAEGSVHDLSVDANGGAQAHLEDVDVAAAAVELNGGSRVEITASDEVTGEVSGGSTLSVTGDARIDVDESGGAEVTNH